MNNRVTMITAVPRNLAKKLSMEKRISNYNNLPQVNGKILDCIQSFLKSQTGFDYLPMACVCKMDSSVFTLEKASKNMSVAGGNVVGPLPIKAKETTLFELSVPEDCIVTIELSDLLTASEEINEMVRNRSGDTEDYLEDFSQTLSVGMLDGENVVAFIPFLDFTYCKLWAVMDKSFQQSDSNIELEGFSVRHITELAAFCRN